MRNHVLAMAAALSCCACANPIAQQAQPPSKTWGTLQSGPYKVGFQRLDLYDKTRGYENNGKGRPIQVSFWYPATPKSDSKPVLINHYVVTAARAQKFDDTPGNVIAERRAGFKEFVGMVAPSQTGRAEEILQTPTAAFWNAPAAKGKFPLVLNVESATSLHSVLSEFLASHGYVVATVERTAVFPGGPAGSGPNPDATEAIVTDMLFAKDLLASKPFVDASKLGITGINATQDGFLYECLYGGVTAIAGVDSGLEEGWMQKHPAYNPKQIRMPIIHIGHGGNWPMGITLGQGYRQLVEVPRTQHPEMYAMAMVTGAPTPLQRTAYQASCTYTLKFFNAFIKGDQQARAWLQKSPEQNGFGGEVRSQILR